MSPSTAEISEAAQNYVASLYNQLFSTVPLLIVGLIVFAVGMGALAVVLSKKLPPMEQTTRSILRIVTMLGVAVACFFALQDVDNHGGIAGIVVLLLLSALAIFALIKKTRWAKYVVVAIIWLYLAPYEIKCLISVLNDYANIQSYAPVGQMGVFAAGNYIVYHAVAATLFAIVLSFAVLLLLRNNRASMPSDKAFDVGFEIEPDKIFYICAAIVLIILAVPAFIYGDLSGYLVDGTTSISNSYVGYLNDYRDDPSVHEDTAWLSSFKAASDELYEADSRFLDISPEAIRRADMILYIQYSEASFSQMQAIEDIYASVCAGESIDEAAGVFNSSIDTQNNALITKLNSISIGDTLNEGPRIAYDSAFYYMRQIGLVPFGVGLIVVGVLCGVAAVWLLRKKPRVATASVPAEAAPEAVSTQPVYDVAVGPTTQSQTESTFYSGLKPAVKVALAVGIIAVAVGYVVVTEVLPAMQDQQEQENGTAFIEEVQATVASRPVSIALWLRDAQDADPGALTPAYLQEGIDLIDAQLSGLKTLATWSDLPSGSEDFGAIVAQLAKDERPILEEMRSALAAGEIPSEELVSEYNQLHSGERGKELETALETFLIQYSIENALNLALD